MVDREAVKMVILLPLLPVRIILGVVAMLVLACMSFFAALGWCAPNPNAYLMNCLFRLCSAHFQEGTQANDHDSESS